MRSFLVIWRKEMACYLRLPLVYAIAVAALLITGLSFWNVLAQGAGTRIDLPYQLFAAPLAQLMMLAVTAVLPMGSFAEERRSGTIESLLTAPVGDIAVVLAKFAAAVSLFIMIYAPSGFYIFVLESISSGVDMVELSQLALSYAMFFLIAMFFIAIGTFFSSITSTPAVAVVATFAVVVLFFYADQFANVLFFDVVTEIAEYGSSMRHLEQFCSGVVDSRPLVLYLTGIWVMLFASIKVVEGRKWR